MLNKTQKNCENKFCKLYTKTFMKLLKPKHKQKVKEYKEKINYNSTLAPEKKKEYANFCILFIKIFIKLLDIKNKMKINGIYV